METSRERIDGKWFKTKSLFKKEIEERYHWSNIFDDKRIQGPTDLLKYTEFLITDLSDECINEMEFLGEANLLTFNLCNYYTKRGDIVRLEIRAYDAPYKQDTSDLLDYILDVKMVPEYKEVSVFIAPQLAEKLVKKFLEKKLFFYFTATKAPDSEEE